MKSLEIVNRNIKAIKKLLYKLKNVQEGTKEDFEKYYHEQELKDFKIIKQDLEVLEIIKKIFEKANFHFYPDGYEADILLEDNDICIEAIDRITKLKVADVKKIKQWLEENE